MSEVVEKEPKPIRVYSQTKSSQIETLTSENLRLEAENRRLQNAVDNMLKSQLDLRALLVRLCSQFGVNFV